MATADEQIRVSDRVKRNLGRRRQRDESYNDVLERLLSERSDGDFHDGFGLLSGRAGRSAPLRGERERAKSDRKDRLRRLGENG